MLIMIMMTLRRRQTAVGADWSTAVMCFRQRDLTLVNELPRWRTKTVGCRYVEACYVTAAVLLKTPSRATSVSDVATSLVTLDSHWCRDQLALYTLLHAPCHIARRHAMSTPVTLREFIMDSAASWFPLDAFCDALINASEMWTVNVNRTFI